MVGERGWRESSTVSLDQQIWKSVWGLETLPKLKHFVWRSCSGGLAVKERLFHRHVVPSPMCSICGGDDESIAHALLYCTVPQQVWQSSSFKPLIDSRAWGSFKEIVVEARGSLEESDLCVFLAIAWAIWKCRNEQVFNNTVPNLEVIIPGFMRLTRDFVDYRQSTMMPRSDHQPRTSSDWFPPPLGYVKVNSDVACGRDGIVGLGVVIRDNNGVIQMVTSKWMERSWSPAMAEAEAGRWALQLALAEGFVNVVLESDAMGLIFALQKPKAGRSTEDLLVDDVCVLGNQFENFLCSHVKRGGNTVAHLAARIACPNSRIVTLVYDFLPEILAMAALDMDE